MYDERTLEERIETYIKDMWSKDKSIQSIYSEVNKFLITLRDSKFISSNEYDQFVAYNDLQKGVFSDERIISKINKNSTLENLHDMYNKQIETGTGQAEFLSNVLLIIKKIPSPQGIRGER